MPDMISTYVRTNGQRVRVLDMHPHHARNALAKILRVPEHAAKQFDPAVNARLHAHAAGLRYVLEVVTPMLRLVGPGPARQTETTTVPTFVRTREEGRARRRVYTSLGHTSTLYRIETDGSMRKVR